MKGSEQRLVEYMDGAKKRFVIPVYQRNYDWKMENCKRYSMTSSKLYEAVERAISSAASFQCIILTAATPNT